MNIREMLLPEFDQEMAKTRITLERIPEDKLAWKPHEKSFSLGDLAMHIANINSWTALTINNEIFDMAPPGAPPFQKPKVNSLDEILAVFDKNVISAREAIAKSSNDHLLKVWTLLSGGKTILSLPRIAALRGFILNHSIHHRAQLGVYLRLNNVPVPAIYGRSADENPF
ncbi:MAG: damage-inducible protein DinB [Candidatus Fischerbacteria bacterium RBG_13_37_8]|uniref:Damage-inducible protein DinB n=1 Tax=Candidatus Fischerbacteria bacterium RBG_13_37_8 TaxID=1817863 RepID=A0A1F5V5I0_9BACT|nr:MAG: damage-inducible protein DinB [Candidatus Fischerbacteria bacterium RBG_13_37_8]